MAEAEVRVLTRQCVRVGSGRQRLARLSRKAVGDIFLGAAAGPLAASKFFVQVLVNAALQQPLHGWATTLLQMAPPWHQAHLRRLGAERLLHAELIRLNAANQWSHLRHKQLIRRP